MDSTAAALQERSLGAVLLDRFRAGRTYTALAQVTALDRALLHCYINGVKSPGIKNALILERVAQIPVYAWVKEQ